jgi:hypothetical protein
MPAFIMPSPYFENMINYTAKETALCRIEPYCFCQGTWSKVLLFVENATQINDTTKACKYTKGKVILDFHI